MNRTPKDRKAVPISHTQEIIKTSLEQALDLDDALRAYAAEYRVPEAIMPSFSYSRRSITSTINHLRSALTLSQSGEF